MERKEVDGGLVEIKTYIHMYTNMELIKLVNYSVARLKAEIFLQ